MHFLHALRESLKRPEQAVQSAIENVAGDLIRFFRSDFVDGHEPYANRLMIQCLENLALSGMYVFSKKLQSHFKCFTGTQIERPHLCLRLWLKACQE